MVTSSTRSISEFISAVAHRGRSIIGVSVSDRQKITSEDVADLCHQLLSSKGEASGIALSFEILSCYQQLDKDEKLRFFNRLIDEFSASPELVAKAAEEYLNDPSDKNLNRLTDVSEPSRRQLILRLNQAPNATLNLIKMREDLLGFLREYPDLADIDRDFSKLFRSWFNGGFLQLQRLDWSSSASILEKIIEYEAVHNMSGWGELRERLDPPDRHIYGFFHPRLNEEPLIFVEVALMANKPSQISAILDKERDFLPAETAKTAVFYSISNCQKGLRGIPLGSFLIKQVVQDLKDSYPSLKEYVTLSPVPSFANWINDLLRDHESDFQLSDDQKNQLEELKSLDWQSDPAVAQKLGNTVQAALAWYLTHQKNAKSEPKDPVARFHLGNGARLERINWPADISGHGIEQSYGAMVNYSYRLDDIEQNHEKFVESGEVSVSSSVARQSRTFDSYLTLVEKTPFMVDEGTLAEQHTSKSAS